MSRRLCFNFSTIQAGLLEDNFDSVVAKAVEAKVRGAGSSSDTELLDPALLESCAAFDHGLACHDACCLSEDFRGQSCRYDGTKKKPSIRPSTHTPWLVQDSVTSTWRTWSCPWNQNKCGENTCWSEPSHFGLNAISVIEVVQLHDDGYEEHLAQAMTLT